MACQSRQHGGFLERKLYRSLHDGKLPSISSLYSHQENLSMSPLTLDEYQKAAAETAIYPRDAALTYPTLGLVGEAGEVAEKVKKIIRDNNGQITEHKRIELTKELGDVLWYLANIAVDLGCNLSDVAQGNLDKLASRAARGKLKGSGDNR
jgi:NTP pyrophosphatase (non-canonical NTP hydrolase)